MPPSPMPGIRQASRSPGRVPARAGNGRVAGVRVGSAEHGMPGVVPTVQLRSAGLRAGPASLAGMLCPVRPVRPGSGVQVLRPGSRRSGMHRSRDRVPRGVPGRLVARRLVVGRHQETHPFTVATMAAL